MQWYVVYTNPRWEKKVAQTLEEKGFDHYCPLHKVRRKWSDRYKVIHEPLFKGYVFVRLDPEKKWGIRSVPGIINFLHYNGQPALVREEEIINIRKFLNEFDGVEVLAADMLPGDTVIIKQGVLMNYKGILLEKTGNKARIRINSLGLQLIATFNTENLEAIPKH